MRSKEQKEARESAMRLRSKLAAAIETEEAVICPRCNRFKLPQEFKLDSNGKRTRSYCQRCTLAYAAEYYARNRHLIASKSERKRLAAIMKPYDG